MSEQARQDNLNARIKVHIQSDIHGYFHDEVSGVSNPEAYMRAMVSDVSKDAELTALLDALDAKKVIHEGTTLPLAELRQERNRLLAASDFTQLADCSLSAQDVADYASYRTYLKDLPEQSPLPESVDDFDTWLSKQ
jgi:hypothetical protein